MACSYQSGQRCSTDGTLATTRVRTNGASVPSTWTASTLDIKSVTEGYSMVTEIAIFTAVSGKEDELGQAILRGLDVIRQHPECISAQVTRCVERPGRYMLTAVWASLEAHVNDLRGGPLFSQWLSHINGLYEGAVEGL